MYKYIIQYTYYKYLCTYIVTLSSMDAHMLSAALQNLFYSTEDSDCDTPDAGIR